MKSSLFNSRGKFSPHLKTGEVMWRCTDGHPNHAIEYTIYFTTNTHSTNHRIHLTPTLFAYPWHKGCLSSIDDLGSVSHSITLGVEFWNSYCSMTFLRTKHTKTTAEINESLSKRGLSGVL